MGSPAIILTSKFTTPNKQDFSKYVNYMSRKKALEEKGYLTDEEKAEFEKIDSGLEGLDFEVSSKKVFYNKSDDEITKEAKTLLNEDDGFEKYISYMTRKGALAEQENLSDEDKKELERLNKALDKLDKTSQDTRELAGVFSIDKDSITLDDLSSVRKKMTAGQKHGSIMWQDVVSFDNKFLIDKGILDPKTDTLDEELLRSASHKMMETFIEKDNLNNPFWFASIHRNREHVHIHFATVEASNSREVMDVNGEQEPRGKRVLSTIDSMKSSFANEMLNMNEQLDLITKQRNKVRENIQQSYLKSISEPDFQFMLNDFIKDLPEDRRKWNYGSLKKPQKEKLNQIVELTLVGDEDYQLLKKSIKDYSDNRKEVYGKTSRSSKDYEKNKMKEIEKRNANALLSSLKKTDKQAQFARSKLGVVSNADPNNFIQDALKVTTKLAKKKTLNFSPEKFKERKQSPIPLRYTRAKAKKIANMFSKKKTTTFEKRKALSAYEEMQARIAMANERG